ncbi:MAG: PAS domain S-box protein [Woeseiaceae bacterium]
MLPIISGYTLSNLYPDWRWSHYPFHSMLESVGAISAIIIATLMIIMVRNNHLPQRYILVACALIAMGLLDGFHAVLHVDVSFVWLHSIATMAGGVIFTAIWLPPLLLTEKRQDYLLFFTIIITLSIGVFSIVSPEVLPSMVVDGRFSLAAKIINIIGGIGFLTGALYFVHAFYTEKGSNEYIRLKHNEEIVFASHCLLFGIAALLFETSVLWDAGWWWWHILRLLAYFVVLVYFFTLFKNEQSRLKYSEIKLEELNNELELRVKARTIDLESERKLLNNILNTATAIIIILDNQGRMIRLNPACEEITGFSFSELHNQPIWEWLIPPEQFDGIKQVFDNLMVGGIDSRYENHLMQKDGGRVLVTWNNSTIADENGIVQYVISIGIDISERQASQLELEKARDTANKANIAKSEFLSRMSHELRTPLNAVLGFAQILEVDEGLNQEQESNIKEIFDAGKHLLYLINEILDLAQIESGKLEIFIETVSVDNILQECTSLMQPQIDTQQVELINNISGKGCYVHADINRLKQVLLNLLSNAVKYNHEHGSITFDSKLVSAVLEHNNINTAAIPTNKQHLRIFITNTGVSLTQDEIARLFVAFERLDVTNNVEGTGIGLVICKHLIELMGGTIGVESNNKGNTFWIELAVSHETEKRN